MEVQWMEEPRGRQGETSGGDEKAKYMPTTISEQARHMLETIPLFPIDPSRSDWPEVVQVIYKFYEQLNADLKAKYVDKFQVIDISGVPVNVITPLNYDPSNDGKAIYYMHGGAYTLHHPQTTFGTWAPLAFQSGLRIYAVDYRLAPDYPYPAAPDDCFTVYQQLIRQYDPERLGLFGDSAGGALALVTALRARKQGLPLPAAVALSSPWSDIGKTGDTYYTNEGLDILIHYEMNLRKSAELYSGAQDMKNPELSPVYAEYPADFPPVMILSSTRDLLLSCCARLNRVLKKAGIRVEMDVFECMWHDFIGFPDIPETDEAYTDISAFFKAHLK
jgi:epsilon-lactone hydrolase